MAKQDFVSPFLLICLLFIFDVAVASQVYSVGDYSGWNSNTNYVQWSNSKEFHVGDVLVFKFNPSDDNVFRVSGDDFAACEGPSPIGLPSTGVEMYTLDRPGSWFFICSIPGRCQAGQKLQVNVHPNSSSPAPTPTQPAQPPSVPSAQPTPISQPPSIPPAQPTPISQPPSVPSAPPTPISQPPSVPPAQPTPVSQPPSVPSAPPTAVSPPPSVPSAPPAPVDNPEPLAPAPAPTNAPADQASGSASLSVGFLVGMVAVVFSVCSVVYV